MATIVIPQDWQAVGSVSGVSPGYGVREDVVGARMQSRASGGSSAALLSLVMPGAVDGTVRVTRADSPSPCWHVAMPCGEVTVWLGDGHYGAVRSNASLTVVLGAVSEPTRVCTVNASALAIGGEPVEVVRSSASMHAVTLVERRDSAWRIIPG